jgi:predicted RNase H-like HicB family nuclease
MVPYYFGLAQQTEIELGVQRAAQALAATVVRKFLVSIYQDEDGGYIAECPSIPGCVSQGQTKAEAESNVADAIRECLEVRAELGMPPTVTTREVEVFV